MHADSDEATGELVHDHEHPVAPEHDGLASKQIHAPQAVSRVSDERQPRGPGAARGGAIVFRQHAVYDVLVDVDPERVRDDARNPRTAEPGIARLELHDGLDECVVRSLRSDRLPALARREQSAVLAMHQRLMKRQECRGAQADGDLPDSPWTEEERRQSANQAVAQREVRRPLATTTKHDQLLLEHEILGDHGSHATGATELRSHNGEVQEGDQEVLHARVSVGQTPGRATLPNPGISARIGNSRPTGPARGERDTGHDVTAKPRAVVRRQLYARGMAIRLYSGRLAKRSTRPSDPRGHRRHGTRRRPLTLSCASDRASAAFTDATSSSEILSRRRATAR